MFVFYLIFFKVEKERDHCEFPEDMEDCVMAKNGKEMFKEYRNTSC